MDCIPHSLLEDRKRGRFPKGTILMAYPAWYTDFLPELEQYFNSTWNEMVPHIQKEHDKRYTNIFFQVRNCVYLYF